MKIFRWLFSNLFLIFLVVAVIYSYMFWGNLAGSDTPVGKSIAYLSSEFVEVEEFINAVKTRQNDKSQDKELAQKSVQKSVKQPDNNDGEAVQAMASQTSTPETQADEPAVLQAAIEPDAETPAVAFKSDIKQQPPVTITYSQNESRIKQNSAGVLEREEISPEPAALPQPVIVAMPEHETPVAVEEEAEDEVMASQGTFVPTEVELQLDNVDKHGQVIDASKQDGAVRNTWLTARKSYYQRDYSLSEQSYQNVIENTKDNYDAYGELGNVYFNQGKKEQAAAAYYEAASILVKKGQINRARSLTGLLRHLDRSKAEALQGLIDSVKAGKLESKVGQQGQSATL